MKGLGLKIKIKVLSYSIILLNKDKFYSKNSIIYIFHKFVFSVKIELYII